MKLLRFKWPGLITLSVAALLAAGCGGSGGGSTPAAAKATISGAVTFPVVNLTRVVDKRTGNQVPDTAVTIEAYTVDGTKVASVTPSYDDSNTSGQRIYAYSFANLDKSKDYVIKAKKLNVALKKLIEKQSITGDLTAQDLNAVSTAAVMVASKKLDVVLGDTLPANKTAADVSTSISTAIKPALLETEINTVVGGGKSAVTTDTQAALANVYNIVVSAAVENVDPAAMFTAAPPALTNTVPILTVTSGVASVTQTTINSTVATSVLTGAASGYTPPASTETAAKYNTLAKNYLTAQDISNAALNYEKALTIDPNDVEANFGGAITSGMMLIEDPDVQTVTSKWGAVVPTVNQIVQGTSPIKLPFGNMTSIRLVPKTVAKSVGKSTSATTTQKVLAAFSTLKAGLPQQKTGFKSLAKELKLVPTTAPSVGEMQTVITNVIIPKVDTILARLAKAEGKGFSFTVTKAMQGNPVNGADVSLSDGEFYSLDAALNIFQVIFKIASAYNFDVPSPYTYDTIAQDPLAMINDTNFFTLKSDGAAKMSSALTNAKAAAAKTKLAYDTVLVRAITTGTVPGVLDLTSWTAQEQTNFTTGLAAVTAALNGPYNLPYMHNDVQKYVTIDATKLFTNPLTKASLPKFGYTVPRDATLSATYGHPVAATRTITDYYFNGTGYSVGGSWVDAIDCEILPTTDLPDYTLNGIFPGNTSAGNFAEFNGILPMMGGSLIHALVNGVPSYDINRPNDNKHYATDGTSLFRLKETINTNNSQLVTRLQQINPATGLSTTLTTVPNDARKLLYVNGKWMIGKLNFSTTQTLDLYDFASTTTAPWPLNTTPTRSIAITGSLGAVTASGNSVYYAVTTSSFNTTLGSWTDKTAIHKLDMATSADTIITSSIDFFVSSLAVYNGYIYTDSREFEVEKRDATTGSLVATYTSGNFNVIIGGYFYKNSNGVLIKYAGKPDGTAAKLAKHLLGF